MKKIKRILSVFLSAAFIASVFCCGFPTASALEDSGFTYTVENGEATITGQITRSAPMSAKRFGHRRPLPSCQANGSF